MRYLLITLALLSLSTFTKSDCLAYEESDYQALKGAFGITSEYSGAAGVKREQVLAFECMMQSDNRLALLNQLFEDGNIAGQLYTLAGFRSVDIVRFYEAKQKLDKQREVTVHALLGCVARKLEVATVIGWIEEGEWPTYSHVVAP